MEMTFTDAAINKIREVLIEEEKPNHALRIFVSGGGCSGFQYDFELAETANEDDYTFEKDGVKVYVDSISHQYLTGATVDYTVNLKGANFVLSNPNATSTCGCGSSFSAG